MAWGTASKATKALNANLALERDREKPYRFLLFEDKREIEPSAITITVQGPFETLSNKKIIDQIYSFVDMKDLKPGVYARHAYINIPVGLIMTHAVPQVFTIKIEENLYAFSN